MHLALNGPTHSAPFCLTQSYRLLQAHPQCIALIHRTDPNFIPATYDLYEDEKIEESNALASSLWEAEALLNHHYHKVASIAKKFKSSLSSAADIRKAPIFMGPDECFDFTYSDWIAEELGKAAKKENAEFAFKKPSSLFPADSLTAKCFTC